MPNDTPNQAPATQSWSRYQQVKKILDDASGEAHPSYQGHDRFWNMPLQELLVFTLYGVRMIAPETGAPVFAAPPPANASSAAAPCCHAPKPKPVAASAAVTPADSQAG